MGLSKTKIINLVVISTLCFFFFFINVNGSFFPTKTNHVYLLNDIVTVIPSWYWL